jgi:uroporphyrinogen decarboxylase
MLHSDGAIRAVIPDLLEMGLQLLNPIQVGAAGMEPAALKLDYGEHLAFHGAIDVQNTLPFGTPEEVRAEVRARFVDLGAGGGYVCSCSHSLLPDVPIDNILAMYETAREECLYRY